MSELSKITVKQYRSLGGEETDNFKAFVYFEGTKVAEAGNSGRGGCNDYYWSHGRDSTPEKKMAKRRDNEKMVMDWVKTLPPHISRYGAMGADLDCLVGDACNHFTLRRDCKKKIVYRVTGMHSQIWFNIRWPEAAPFWPSSKAEVLKEIRGNKSLWPRKDSMDYSDGYGSEPLPVPDLANLPDEAFTFGNDAAMNEACELDTPRPLLQPEDVALSSSELVLAYLFDEQRKMITHAESRALWVLADGTGKRTAEDLRKSERDEDHIRKSSSEAFQAMRAALIEMIGVDQAAA